MIKQRESAGFLMLIPSAALALVVVFGLLYLMQMLINSNLTAPEETETIKIGDIWQEEQEIEENVKEREIEEIDDVEEPPPELPKADIDFEADDAQIDFSTNVATAKVDISLGAGFTDGDIIPLVAIQPDYPRRAAERGLEGYCVVSFVITTLGTTRDIKEEECSSSTFRNSSIKAAERLKYKPRVIDGTPVEVDHYYKFTYTMAQ